MKKLFVVSFLTIVILISNITKANAQTHPCDGVIVPNPAITSPAKVGFCFDGKNTDGSPVIVSAFKVYLGTNTTPTWTGLVQPIGAANGAGVNYYETPPITFGTGTISVKVTVSSVIGGEGVASAPFTFSVTTVKPGTVSIIRIVK